MGGRKGEEGRRGRGQGAGADADFVISNNLANINEDGYSHSLSHCTYRPWVDIGAVSQCRKR